MPGKVDVAPLTSKCPPTAGDAPFSRPPLPQAWTDEIKRAPQVVAAARSPAGCLMAPRTDVAARHPLLLPGETGSGSVRGGCRAPGPAAVLSRFCAMSRMYRAAAFSPDVLIGEHQGVPVMLETVVLRMSGVLVFCAGCRNHITEQLDAAWREAFEHWKERAKAARERGEEPPRPPEQPGSALAEIPLVIRDDAGTTYRRAGTQWGGNKTEWEAFWKFQPAVPAAARELTVVIDTDECRQQAFTASL